MSDAPTIAIADELPPLRREVLPPREVWRIERRLHDRAVWAMMIAGGIGYVLSGILRIWL